VDETAVYLSGPMGGCSEEERHGWREHAKSRLKGCTVFDPTRRDWKGRDDECYGEIVTTDLEEIRQSAIMLVNAFRPSWGTAMEVFYAYREISCTVYTFVPPDLPVNPWLRFHSHRIYRSLDQAIDATNSAVRVVLGVGCGVFDA
jgi:nucleoside 2-deoxyribosyltransferase